MLLWAWPPDGAIPRPAVRRRPCIGGAIAWAISAVCLLAVQGADFHAAAAAADRAAGGHAAYNAMVVTAGWAVVFGFCAVVQVATSGWWRRWSVSPMVKLALAALLLALFVIGSCSGVASVGLALR